jgi:competence protein ComEA
MPPVPVVLAAFVFLTVLLGRGASVMEDIPSFLSQDAKYVHVELTGCGLTPGVYQINDGFSLRDVIKLTIAAPDKISSSVEVYFEPVNDGAIYTIAKKDQKIKIVRRGWMSASKRIALNIPLHPDRMSRTDWVALPGIGDKLAERIHIDRQKNGDFGSLDALKRVKGIGQGRIDSWRIFFKTT